MQHKTFNIKTHDHLTNLVNMGTFLRLSEQILREADQNHTYDQYSFIYFNIKGFKNYNLENGLESGDLLLQKLAFLLVNEYPKQLLSRFSSDHFVCLCTNEFSTTNIFHVQQQFNYFVQNNTLQLHAGIYPIHNENISAARACDLAKTAVDVLTETSHSIYVYDDGLEKKLTLDNYIRQNIDIAIEQGYIQIYFQPIIRALTNKICSFEALARWIDPNYGFLSPADFIPVLENSNLIDRLDRFMIKEICRQFNKNPNLSPKVPVSINISRLDLLKSDFVQYVNDCANHYQVPKDLIRIELTESTIMHEPNLVKSILNQFQANGYQVWMDDFGSGFSSLNVLKDYHFDVIKLDMGFLKDINPTSEEIIKSIITMAKNLHIITLCEGVETQDQFDFLKRIGCDYVQGYLLGRPVSLEQVGNYWGNKSNIENYNETKYYDSLNQVNFLSEDNIAITEYDGNKFTYLYISDGFSHIIHNAGASNLDEVYFNMNSTDSPLSSQFRQFQDSLSTSDEYKQMDYIVRGHSLRLRGRVLGRNHNKVLGEAILTDITVKTNTPQQEIQNQIYRQIYSMYDGVYKIDVQNNCLSEITMKDYAKSNLDDELNSLSLTDAIPFAAKNFIHPDDQDAFKQFTDLSTLVSRFNKSINHCLTSCFRTFSGDCQYVWQMHYILPLDEQNTYLYCMKVSHLLENHIITVKNNHELIYSLQDEENFMQEYSYYLQSLDHIDDNHDLRNIILLQKNMLDSIAKSYISLALVNLSNDTFITIDALPYVGDILKKYSSAQAALNKTSELLMKKSYIDRVKEFLNLKTLSHRIGNQTSITFDFNGQVTGWCRGHFIPVQRDAEGNVIQVIYIVQQIQNEKQREESLRILSEQDRLTGLNNRVSGEEKIEEYLKTKTPGLICLFDIDHFKHINDTYGHQIGDKVLIEIAKVMQNTFRKDDILMRLGGDEFLMYIKGKTVNDNFEPILNRFIHNIEEIKIATLPEMIHVSLGYVNYAGYVNTTFDDLYRDADQKMYLQKEQHKNVH